MKYTGTEQVVRNFDGKYKGAMTMREALYNSRNVPAVKTLKEVGTKNAKEFINRFGIDIGEVHESSCNWWYFKINVPYSNGRCIMQHLVIMVFIQNHMRLIKLSIVMAKQKRIIDQNRRQ